MKVYLDYAATAPILPEVISLHDQVLKATYASPSAPHILGLEANRKLEESRSQIANLLNVKYDEIIFTSCASESNNLVLKGFLNRNRRHIITSNIEHPSISNVLKQLVDNFNYQVTYLKVNQSGQIILEQLRQALQKDTILVSLILVNNEVGSINDLVAIRKIIDEHNAANHTKTLLHIDATQAIGKINVDLKLADTAAFSFHKIGGLKGCGILYRKKGISLLKLIDGGEQEFDLRSGTVNLPSIIANAKALEIACSDLSSKNQRLAEITKYLKAALLGVGAVINTPEISANTIVNASIPPFKGAILVNALSEAGFHLSTTSSCSSKSTSYSNTVLMMYNDMKRASEAIRISYDATLKKDEIDAFIKALEKTMRVVRHG